MEKLPKFINKQIQAEYDRLIKKIGHDDPYLAPKCLGIHDVIDAHFHIADFFMSDGTGLGGVGPANMDLLHSAMYRQHFCFDGKCKYTDLFDMAATLLYGLVKDHPFFDANKRTAFLSVIYLLRKNGYTPSVPHKEFEDFLVDVADNKIAQKSRYQEDAQKYDDPEIRYISRYLRKNTREIDKKLRIITFRELKKILNKFSFDIKNPHQGYIDVVRLTTTRIPFSKATRTVEKRVTRVRFPGFTKEVAKHTLRKIREACELTEEHEIDSEVFFNGADTLDLLLANYREPLKRLADR